MFSNGLKFKLVLTKTDKKQHRDIIGTTMDFTSLHPSVSIPEPKRKLGPLKVCPHMRTTQNIPTWNKNSTGPHKSRHTKTQEHCGEACGYDAL